MAPDLIRPCAKNSPQTISETTLTRIFPMPSKKSLKVASTSFRFRYRISSQMIAITVEITMAVTTSMRIALHATFEKKMMRKSGITGRIA